MEKIKMIIKTILYENSMADKPHLNMIITGHIDNGKSTTMGHFLMDLGVVDQRTIDAHACLLYTSPSPRDRG